MVNQHQLKKMYCNANINDDFYGNYIYIILTKEKIDYYRQYKQELNSANNFRRIFRIELEEYSKENVLNVIRKLESVDKFKYVGVEYNYDLIKVL